MNVHSPAPNWNKYLPFVSIDTVQLYREAARAVYTGAELIHVEIEDFFTLLETLKDYCKAMDAIYGITVHTSASIVDLCNWIRAHKLGIPSHKHRDDVSLTIRGGCIHNCQFDGYRFDTEISVASTFLEKVSFSEAVFERPIHFGSSTFVRLADFTGAKFEADARFSNSDFMQESQFFYTSFADETDFSYVRFSNNTHFTHAEFNQNAGNASFVKTIFSKEACFAHAVFARTADFGEAKFRQDSFFRNATFHDAHFWKATFDSEAYFENSTFLKDSYFSQISFSSGAHFLSVTFEQAAAFFDETIFKNSAKFQGANFSLDASFRDVSVHTLLDLRLNRLGENKLSVEDLNVRPGANVYIDLGLLKRKQLCGKPSLYQYRPIGQDSFSRLIVAPMDKTLDLVCFPFSFTSYWIAQYFGIGVNYTLIRGEESDNPKELRSASTQYNILRNTFRQQPSTDQEEDTCHFRYMDLARRAAWRNKPGLWKRIFLGFEWLVYRNAMGYLIYPVRIFASAVFLWLFFALVYGVFASADTITHSGYADNQSQAIELWNEHPIQNSLYFSIMTFVTLGYGDFAPNHWFKLVAGLEGLLGVVMLALFTVAWGRKMIR